MSYHRTSERKWLITGREGNSPVFVVSGERYRAKKQAEKRARNLNQNPGCSGILDYFLFFLGFFVQLDKSLYYRLLKKKRHWVLEVVCDADRTGSSVHRVCVSDVYRCAV
jgi:hypothetical protein